jgi:hypothetical protein
VSHLYKAAYDYEGDVDVVDKDRNSFVGNVNDFLLSPSKQMAGKENMLKTIQEILDNNFTEMTDLEFWPGNELFPQNSLNSTETSVISTTNHRYDYEIQYPDYSQVRKEILVIFSHP